MKAFRLNDLHQFYCGRWHEALTLDFHWADLHRPTSLFCFRSEICSFSPFESFLHLFPPKEPLVQSRKRWSARWTTGPGQASGL